MKKGTFYLTILSTVLFFVLSCTGNKGQGEATVMTSAEIEIAFEATAKQYQLLCSGCHGNQIGAFVDREWKNGHSDSVLIHRISEGDEEDGMPSFKDAMSEEDIAKMAAYINSSIEAGNLYEFKDRPDISSVFEAEKFSYKLDLVIGDLEIPWGMAFLPGGEMLITERSGKMYRLSADRKLTEIENVPASLNKGQGGLMDVELHPEYEKNGMVYLSYSIFKEEDGKTVATTAISRAKLNGNSLEELELLFVALPYSSKGQHFGCRLEFDKEGYLYFSVGDRGRRDENPQSLENHCGKIHRINDDGSIPDDNPFVGVEGAMPTIYSYGHRNPQGVIMHPETGEIWTHEHGPRGGDEINIIKPGRNYGWPLISYGINYNGTIFTTDTEMEGMEQPLHYWVPSIAPCGMDFISSDKYPGWKGSLLVGSLRFQYLNRCEIVDGQVASEELLLKNLGRVRNVKEGPDGFIYVAVEKPGRIFRLVPE